MTIRSIEDTQKEAGQLSIAILARDIVHAKALSDALREFGVFPHVYQELDEFWVATKTQLPDLAIVDVTKMSQGTLIFKHHPRVVEGKLNVAFYYTNDSKFLLNSTFNYQNVGTIDSGLNLVGQIQSILNRLIQSSQQSIRLKSLHERVNRLQVRSSRMLEELNTSIQFQNRQNEIKALAAKISKRLHGADFASALVSSLCEWDVVEKFGFLEINEAGQRLIGADFIRTKYVSLPSLWLGQESKQGIQSHAMEMANQVAYELIDADLIKLTLNARYTDPELVIFIKQSSDVVETIDWSLVQELITACYRQYKIGLNDNQVLSRVMNAWEMLSIQDEIHYQNRKADIKLINISFSNLLATIRSKYSNRFFWKAFYRDFITQLDDHLTEDTFYSLYGVNEILLMSEKESFEANFMNVENFVKSFSYWKYFADSSTLITNDLTPKVSIVAPSSLNYLRMVEQDFDQAAQELKRVVHSASQIMPKTSARPTFDM
jgi:hypothetical protein